MRKLDTKLLSIFFSEGASPFPTKHDMNSRRVNDILSAKHISSLQDISGIRKNSYGWGAVHPIKRVHYFQTKSDKIKFDT